MLMSLSSMKREAVRTPRRRVVNPKTNTVRGFTLHGRKYTISKEELAKYILEQSHKGKHLNLNQGAPNFNTAFLWYAKELGYPSRMGNIYRQYFVVDPKGRLVTPQFIRNLKKNNKPLLTLIPEGNPGSNYKQRMYFTHNLAKRPDSPRPNSSNSNTSSTRSTRSIHSNASIHLSNFSISAN